PSRTSSMPSPSARSSTRRWRRYRPTWTSGSSSTTANALTPANIVSDARLCRHFRRPNTWHRPNNWIRFLNGSIPGQTSPTTPTVIWMLSVRSLVSDEILSFTLEDWLQLSPTVVADLLREDRRPTLLVYPSHLFLSLFQPHPQN